ncbi:MAG: paraslipin [Leptospirales bacterium]|nr:paraslipin [Leptospirales bacterium]
METVGMIIFIIFGIYVFIKFALSIRIVPAQEVYLVERLGKFHKALGSGFHSLIPFLDRITYKLTLKEEAIDVPVQVCITGDNVQIQVDGVIYMKVEDPYRAAYNVSNYRYALIQLAQTAMRAALGHLELDKTFEERETLNAKIVKIVDDAAEPWGINILRYEIQNITPPKSILQSMEKQMTAERDKRATIARSEGEKTSRINKSEGMKQELINKSEGEKQKTVNQAEGEASEIKALAIATATGLKKIAEAVGQPGGAEAMRLSLIQEYLRQMEGLAKSSTRVVLPLNMADLKETLGGLGLKSKQE